MSQKRSKGSAGSVSDARATFSAAIKRRELNLIRQLIDAGHKPDAAAARQSVDACIKAYETSGGSKATFVGRRPLRTAKKPADADLGYEIAEAILDAGAPVPELLCSAARCGHENLALLLIRHGADVDYDPPMGTPLENAVSAGSVGIVRALIQAGADLNHQGIRGTLLERAISANQPEVAAALIQAGVDVNASARLGATALLTAVTNQNGEFVRLLLGAGADVNQKGTIVCGDFGAPKVTVEGGLRTTHIPNPPVAREATPLIVAVRRGDKDIARKLIDSGANLQAVDAEGFTAHVRATQAGNASMVRLLEQAGATPPKHPEGSASAAWIAAAKAGHCARLKALLADGLDVNLEHVGADQSQETALKNAAANGHVTAVRWLLAAGADPNQRFRSSDTDQQTALMSAASAGQTAVAKALIAAGAEVMAKDRLGATVLHYAAQGGSAATINLLLRAGAKIESKTRDGTSPLMTAAGEGHVEAVRALLNAGAEPNRFSDGMTALSHAAMAGHAAVVQALLDAKADPGIGSSTFNPLQVASSGGHAAVVKVLLKAQKLRAGAAAKNRSPTGKTGKTDPAGNQLEAAREAGSDAGALAMAAFSGQAEIVRALLDAGADPNAPGEVGLTPLMGAVHSGNIEAVKLLLKAGAEVNVLNEGRKTALDVAHDSIKLAKAQLRWLELLDGDDADAESREARRVLRAFVNEGSVTAVLKDAGARRAKELKGKRLPRPVAAVAPPKKRFIEVKAPDFTERVRQSGFQRAVEELKRLTGQVVRPVPREGSSRSSGGVLVRLPSETADQLLAMHQRSFLDRGCFLVRSKRGYTTGKDELMLLPTSKRSEVLATFRTNGGNCDVDTHDVIDWLDQLEKREPFLLTGAGFDWCEGAFTQPLADSKKLAKQIFEFCPDVVTQGTGDVPSLALELRKTRRFFLWWD